MARCRHSRPRSAATVVASSIGKSRGERASIRTSLLADGPVDVIAEGTSSASTSRATFNHCVPVGSVARSASLPRRAPTEFGLSVSTIR